MRNTSILKHAYASDVIQLKEVETDTCQQSRLYLENVNTYLPIDVLIQLMISYAPFHPLPSLCYHLEVSEQRSNKTY